MSRSPDSAKSAEPLDEYAEAWTKLAHLIRLGRSFSGHERKCLFLNTHEHRFADVSAASGFDLDDDGRGLAFTDWDHDGDLDVWMANRTGPRLRMLRNDHPHDHHFVALRLAGDPALGCPRDAIGARVELRLADAPNPTRIKTLYAGDGYLSQSTKWIHFGLGKHDKIASVSVRWPGANTAEEFAGVAADGRFELVQGFGKAKAVASGGPIVELAVKPALGRPTTDEARIVLVSPRGMPDLSIATLAGGNLRLADLPPGPVLINLWGTSCKPCLKELKEMAESSGSLAALDLSIVPLCVDGIDETRKFDPAAAAATLNRLGVTFPSGMATPDAVMRLDNLQQSLVYRQRPLPLPSSFLFDRKGALRVVYKGPVTVEQLSADVRDIHDPQVAPRDMLAAFPGRWGEDYFVSNMIAVAQIFMEEQRFDQAQSVIVEFLGSQTTAAVAELAIPLWDDIDAETWHQRLAAYLRGEGMQPREGTDRESLAYNSGIGQAFRLLGDLHLRAKRRGMAVACYQQTLRFFPRHRQTRLDLCDLLSSLGRYDEATEVASWLIAQASPEGRIDAAAVLRLGDIHARQSRPAKAIEMWAKALEREVEPQIAARLAWVLATHPDARIRDGKRALSLAAKLCEAAPGDARFLDLRAAAEAETGDFERAAQTADEAARIAKAGGFGPLATAIDGRRNAYRKGQSFRDDPADRKPSN